ARLGSKLMEFDPPAAAASAIAWRRLPTPLSLVFSTVNVAKSKRFSSVSTASLPRCDPCLVPLKRLPNHVPAMERTSLYGVQARRQRRGEKGRYSTQIKGATGSGVGRFVKCNQPENMRNPRATKPGNEMLTKPLSAECRIGIEGTFADFAENS